MGNMPIQVRQVYFWPSVLKKRPILHITHWYPNDYIPQEGIWVQNHIRLLDEQYASTVIHVHIRRGALKIKNESITEGVRMFIWVPEWLPWRSIELLIAYRLKKLLRRMSAREKYDLVNFHIAYPALVYLNYLQDSLPKRKFLIEHSSSYHFHFRSNRPLERIKKIFRRSDIVYAAVSEQLAEDIRNFSHSNIKIHILPNSVDTEKFSFVENERPGHFLMCAVWSEPKRPFDVLEALVDARAKGEKFYVRIAGRGRLWPAMEKFVLEHALSDQVEMLGPINHEELAKEMHAASALLLPTEYETFSVIAFEALCCGLPVFTYKAGALANAIHSGNGIFVASPKAWPEAMRSAADWNNSIRKKIASEADALVNENRVRQIYLSLLEEDPMNEVSKR